MLKIPSLRQTPVLLLCGLSLLGMRQPAQAETNSAYMGINVSNPADYDSGRTFADAMKSSRRWGNPNSPWDQAASVDSNGWPTGDAGITVFAGITNMQGTYALSFTGNASVSLVASGGSIQGKAYNGTTNITTASVVVTDSNQNALYLKFTGQSGGVKNVKLMRPTYPGSSTSYSTSTTFTDQFKSLVSKFSTIRFMDWESTNGNMTANWWDRTTPTYATQAARLFGTNPYGGAQNAGVAWEYCIQLCNETGKDMWINVPALATGDYVWALASLIKSNLNPNLKVYIEYSNEVWNTGFLQGQQNHQLAINEVNAGGSPLNFDGDTSDWDWAWRRVGKRAKEISDSFRWNFGDSAMMSRVRPILAWQQNNGQASGEQELRMAEYIAEQNGKTVPYYIYGGGGSAYYNPNDNSDSLTLSNIWNDSSFNTTNWTQIIKRDTYLCATYGIKQDAYEGGPGLDNTGHSEATKAAAVNDGRMSNQILDHQNTWSSYGGDLLMYYTSTGDYQWGFTNDIFNINTPKLHGIDLLNSNGRYTTDWSDVAPSAPLSVSGAQFSLANPGWRSPGTGSLSLNANSDGGQWVSYIVKESVPVNRYVSVSTNAAGGQMRMWIDGQYIGDQNTAYVNFSRAGLHSVRLAANYGSFNVNSISIQ